MDDFTKVVIEDIREEANGTRSFYFNIPEGMTWKAGSDMHIAFPDFMDSEVIDKSLVRHMSLMTVPEEGRVGFTTRTPGSGSEYKKRLKSMKTGDEIVIFKLGNRIPLRREGKQIVLISMGVGAATIRPMILEWIKDSTDIPSIINLVVDKKDQFVFKKEWESTPKSNLTHMFCENRNSFYTNFESLQFDGDKIFYIVGSDIFLEDLIRLLKAKGVQPENIEIDKKPDKRSLMLGIG